MAENNLTKIDSFQYPAAHLGHLTEVQQSALDSFKKLCQKQGYYHSAGTDGRTTDSHDDETLLRYLRARKFQPEEAVKQFKATEDWRKENHLDELYNTIDVKEYDETRRLYPQWTGRRDRRGIPVYVFEVAHLNSKTISAYEKSVSKSATVASKVPIKMLRLFALYENLTRFVLPLCSAIRDRPHPETPVSQSNNIVDINNVGLKQFWNLKSHMQDASTLATAYYPETLDRIFIIGAPGFFPTVWSWIKRWFDPITVSKIFILHPSDMKQTLEKYIAPENIPKKYGGTLEYQFGDMPILEDAITNNLNWADPTADLQSGYKSIPTGPIKWQQAADGTLSAVAVGKQDGKPRERTIATVATEFVGLHGISRQNTAIDWKKEAVKPTDGISTQPQEGDPNLGEELLDNSGTATPMHANTTTSLPARPIQQENTLSPSDTQPRTGTSDTRAEQQDGTHAAGNTTAGTPHTVSYGSGEKAQTIEPSTVGQAPKDHSANLPSRGPATQDESSSSSGGLLVQAQHAAQYAVGAASTAAGSVASALGVGEKKHEELGEKGGAEEVKGDGLKGEQDKLVEGMTDRHVEEFLRGQVDSTSKGKGKS
ncbi:CRAL/TRIO domain-containing protein [Tothia fuscella]|uniref:CRAL/TRIO domain-containing protein n=1 Tax=Tothia fuscella TaxID=1048955 RepID=A0A9P4NWU6_9PEZI|nr:CRAL/TRIO domain-containing protein [Tothia fuscella]